MIEFDREENEKEIRRQYRLISKHYGKDSIASLAHMRDEGVYLHLYTLVEKGKSEDEAATLMLCYLEREHRIKNHPLYELSQLIEQLDNDLYEANERISEVKAELNGLMTLDLVQRK